MLALTRFNDYGPLLELKHYDQDLELLLECKEIFEREKYIPGLGSVFGALASLEHKLGHFDQAIRFSDASLRYDYLTDRAEHIFVDHRNQAVFLSTVGSEKALAHNLAAGIICHLIHSGSLSDTLHNLSCHLAQFGPQSLPSSFDQVCRTVEEVEGVRFRELFRRLAGPETDGNQVMQKVVEMTKQGLK